MPNLKTKITVTAIQRLMPGDTMFDTDIKGFGARRQLGSISYFVKTRVLGRQKWFTIGKHGSPWTPETARKEARKIITEAIDGTDRTIERERLRAAATFQELATNFQTTYGPKLKPRTLEEYEGLIRRYLIPAFGRHRVDAIVRGDVTRAHAQWQEHPRTANHALAVLSKMLSWAEEHGLRESNSNPCFGIRKYKETKRQRYLSMAELEKLGEALDQVEREQLASPSAISAIRLLILTGARLNEILTLRWSYIDKERRLLMLPDSKTGQKTIQLSDAAYALLMRIKPVQGNLHIIPGHRLGQPMVELFKPWSVVRDLAGMPDVRIHDLRHTFASVAVAQGGSLPIIGKMLGHRETQTTARYAHLTDDPVRKLTQTTGQIIADAIMPKAASPRE